MQGFNTSKKSFSECPFLIAHRVSPRPGHYDLGALLSPISIRDQMLRGYLAVVRGIDAGLLGGPKKPLLIIGAGIAGVTAAVTAANRQVPTYLVDKQARLCRHQQGCRRHIDPTQYDWPWLHWDSGTFPWEKSSGFPFELTAGEANRMILPLIKAVSILRGKGLLHFYPNTTARPEAAKKAPGRSHAYQYPCSFIPSKPEFRTNLKKIPKKFSMVLSCKGFHQERCYFLQNPRNQRSRLVYQGPAFWENDRLEKPYLGTGGNGEKEIKILISGGGDGALQDYLRVLTRKPVKEIYAILRQGFEHEFSQLERKIQNVESQAARHYIWNNHNYDQPLFEKVQQVHLEAIHSLRYSPNWDVLSDRLGALVKQSLETELIRPLLIHRHRFFTQAYPFNRFLVLLFQDFLANRKQGQLVTVLSETEIVKIKHNHRELIKKINADRKSILDSDRTWTAPPNLWQKFWAGPCKITLNMGGQIPPEFAIGDTTKEMEFDFLVLRHGVEPHKRELIAYDRRQIPPFHTY